MSLFKKDGDKEVDKSKQQQTEGDSKPDENVAQYVTKDDFNSFKDDLLSRFNTQPQAAPVPAAPPQEAPKITVSQEEIQQAFEDGDNAKASKLLAKLNEEQAAVTTFNIQNQFESQFNMGVDAIANVTKEVAKSGMPLYERFQADIDKRLAMVPASMRMDPNTIRSVYNMVVGENTDALVKEAHEAALRKEADDEVNLPSGNANAGDPKEEVLKGLYDEVFSPDSLKALKSMKGSPNPDQYAQKMGYKDANDYLMQTHPERFPVESKG